MNAKKEILKRAEGEIIEAVELYLNEETDVIYLRLSREKGVRFLFPKMFKGHKVPEAIFLIDYEFDPLYGDESMGPIVTVWTKSGVIFNTFTRNGQRTFRRVDRNPGKEREQK